MLRGPNSGVKGGSGFQSSPRGDSRLALCISTQRLEGTPAWQQEHSGASAPQQSQLYPSSGTWVQLPSISMGQAVGSPWQVGQERTRDTDWQQAGKSDTAPGSLDLMLGVQTGPWRSTLR